MHTFHLVVLVSALLPFSQLVPGYGQFENYPAITNCDDAQEELDDKQAMRFFQDPGQAFWDRIQELTNYIQNNCK